MSTEDAELVFANLAEYRGAPSLKLWNLDESPRCLRCAINRKLQYLDRTQRRIIVSLTTYHIELVLNLEASVVGTRDIQVRQRLRLPLARLSLQREHLP